MAVRGAWANCWWRELRRQRRAWSCARRCGELVELLAVEAELTARGELAGGAELVVNSSGERGERAQGAGGGPLLVRTMQRGVLRTKLGKSLRRCG